MIKDFILFSIFLGFFFSTIRCDQSSSKETSDKDDTQQPFERLSQYQFFTGEMKNLQPSERVLPYDLNSPLFSDYAEKSRFVWMPENTTAEYREGRAFKFPQGAILIKNFFYENENDGASNDRRIIETRLLVNKESGWDAMTYIWNDEQTEAILNIAGDIKEVTYKGESFNYLIPNRNQCKNCHSYDGKMMPIGPKVHQLNKSYPYADGEMNQLEKWSSVGYLTGYQSSDKTPIAAKWDHPESAPLHDRAMGYLDSNCGHCHNPHGSANTSGLNLTYDEPIGINLGVLKAPVSSGKGSGGRLYSIVPGKPEQSILVYRMESTDPGAMMPELGRQMVHEEGVALIKEWVAAMN